MWKEFVNFMHKLFPGEQLETLAGMIAVAAFIIFHARARAERYDRMGWGSIVFFTEQKFQTLFGNQPAKNMAPELKKRTGRRHKAVKEDQAENTPR